jgi:dihydroorotate dehydrogenase (NAD+) catalytic subunit
MGLRWSGSEFVAKTTTLLARAGNMPLTKGYAPAQLKPPCILVKPLAGVALNSVGLSGPGSEVLFAKWREAWLRRDVRRGFISFMSVQDTPAGRLAEAEGFARAFHEFCLQVGTMNVGLQVNFSCPNVNLPTEQLVSEVSDILGAFAVSHACGVPVIAKFSAASPVEDVVKACRASDNCDGISVSNTIPWGKLPDRIDWKGLFGSDASPLAHLGGGGLSGKPLLPIVRDWVIEARKLGFTKPIVAGGGVLSKRDADAMLDVGADAVEIGSAAILRPWRVRGIIKHVLMRTGWKER